MALRYDNCLAIRVMESNKFETLLNTKLIKGIKTFPHRMLFMS